MGSKIKLKLFSHCSFSILLLFISCFLGVKSDDDTLLLDEPGFIVQVAQGQLKGRQGSTLYGRKFTEFLGIPYAKPPRRFQPSERSENWEGIKNATDFGPKCAQYEGNNNFLGIEDCLILNVHTPALLLNGTKKFPVIVFIHGGSFQAGGFWAEFGPEYLMEQDVVYVAVNYRLGALGFLSTGDDLVSGNNGMKDQVLALKFIQENIHAFGGDKERVTIIGESAGAAGASYHLLSPMSKGLFHRAISLSGSAFCPWAIARRPRDTFGQLAEILNCTGNSTKESLDCLEKADYKDILRNQALPKWFLDPIAAFGPVVENGTGGNRSDIFITDSPYKLLEEGKIENKVPWIAGSVTNEGLLLHAADILRDLNKTEELDRDWLRIAPLTLMYDEVVPREDQDNISKSIRNFYFGNNTISNLTRNNLGDLYSDRFFVHPVQRAAKLYAKHGGPTYLYLFSYAGEYSFADSTPGNPNKVVSHGDDTPYILHATFRPNYPNNATSLNFARKYINLWKSFAATGVPEGTWSGAKDWPRLPIDASNSSINSTWYIIDDVTQLIQEPFYKRMKFWDSLPLAQLEADAI